jgi:hypothetical protein
MINNLKTTRQVLLNKFWLKAIDYANEQDYEDIEDKEERYSQWLEYQFTYRAAALEVIDFILGTYALTIPNEESELKSFSKDIQDQHQLLKQKAEALKEKFFPEDLLQTKSNREALQEKAEILRKKIYGNTVMKETEREAKIKETYGYINNVLSNQQDVNDKQTRRWVIDKIQQKMEFDVIAICNDENNPPEIVDANILVVDLLWNTDYTKTFNMTKARLIFGQPDQVEKYQQKLYYDQTIQNFIFKGI